MLSLGTRFTRLTSAHVCASITDRVVAMGEYCALCGKRCYGKKQAVAGSYGGQGLPPAEKLEEHVDPAWLTKKGLVPASLPVLPDAGWLHNESKASGRDCYLRAKAVWGAVGTKQVRPPQHHLAQTVGQLTITPPSLLVPLPTAGAGEHRRADGTRARRRRPARRAQHHAERAVYYRAPGSRIHLRPVGQVE